MAELANAQAHNRRTRQVPACSLVKVRGAADLFVLAHHLMRIVAGAPIASQMEQSAAGRCWVPPPVALRSRPPVIATGARA